MTPFWPRRGRRNTIWTISPPDSASVLNRPAIVPRRFSARARKGFRSFSCGSTRAETSPSASTRQGFIWRNMAGLGRVWAVTPAFARRERTGRSLWKCPIPVNTSSSRARWTDPRLNVMGRTIGLPLQWVAPSNTQPRSAMPRPLPCRARGWFRSGSTAGFARAPIAISARIRPQFWRRRWMSAGGGRGNCPVRMLGYRAGLSLYVQGRPARGREFPLLRRSGPAGARRAKPADRDPSERDLAQPYWPCRRHYPVEHTVYVVHMEDRPCLGRGLHRGP